MCVQGKFIHNPYDGREYFVKCGHCEACLQEKADRRAFRIMNEALNGYLCLFITFHYENKYVPYIKSSEVSDFIKDQSKNLNVYRDEKVIQTLTLSDFVERGKIPVINNLNIPLDFITSYRSNSLHFLKDRVSVCYNRDIQLFFKRLNRYLFRHGYDDYFSYFYCSEYGSKFKRCHFHSLFFIPPQSKSLFESAVCACWHYANMRKPFRQTDGCLRFPIEIAKNPAKYVASYVNQRENVSQFLSKLKPFKMRYRFSNGFGCNFKEFTLDSILEKVKRGTLSYSVKSIKNGVSTVSDVRIPKYVLSRYFPKFKGYRYLLSDEIVKFLQNPAILRSYQKINPSLKILSDDEKEQIIKRFTRLRSRIPSDLRDDWCFSYPSVWRIYSSDSIRDSYKDVRTSSDLFQHFHNIKDLFDGSVRNDFVMQFTNILSYFETDPNKFSHNIAKHDNLVKKYFEQIKHHSIKNSFYEK